MAVETQKYRTVRMEDVPEPPAVRVGAAGWVKSLFLDICRLPGGEKAAIEIQVASRKAAYSLRSQLRGHAKHHGRRLLSSRSVDGLTLYFWLADQEPAAKR